MFQTMFMQRADERDDVADMLQDHVRQLGGEPADSGTILAGTHRAFMSIRDALTNRDDAALVAEIERGEDHIKAKFEAAMTQDGLSAETRAVIGDCYTLVRSGHDQMRDLKHSLEKGPDAASRPGM